MADCVVCSESESLAGQKVDIILCFSIYGEGADFSRRKERLELIEKRKKVIEIVIRTFEMF